MKSSEQLTDAAFIVRFIWEMRGPGDGFREWRVRLEHIESQQQFNCSTFEQIEGVFESYGFTEKTGPVSTLLRKDLCWLHRR